MEQLGGLCVENGQQQMELSLKPEGEDSYIFCKTAIVDGVTILHPSSWHRTKLLRKRTNGIRY